MTIFLALLTWAGSVGAVEVATPLTISPFPTAGIRTYWSDDHSINVPIVDLMANPKTRMVVEANFPGIAAHPMYDAFKGLSLAQLARFAKGGITDRMLSKTDYELSRVH